MFNINIMHNIGFIGLGLMGKPMAINLIKAGYSVIVYNRSKPAIDELISMGASSAKSPKDLAQQVNVIISILPDAPDTKKVLFGKNGVIEGINPNSIFVDMSTISPIQTKLIGNKLLEKHVSMLDAPVSGGDIGAKAGTLAIMVGGKKEDFKKCLPIFRAMGKTIIHVGNSGSGQLTKLCNQVVIAGTLSGVCEALVLGSKSGVNIEKILGAISSGAASSWQLSNLAPKIIDRDFEPGFKVSHLMKDLKYALETGEELNIAMPTTSLVNQLYNSVLAEKMGEKGIQSLIVSLEKLSKFTVKK